MDKPTILKTLVWLRRKYPDQQAELTLYGLFVQAFIEHFHVHDENSQSRIGRDLEAFEYQGNVPLYVLRFMRRQCSLHFIPQRTKEGDRTCVSAN